MPIVSSAEILEIKSHGDNIKEFTLRVEEFENFEAGQFLQLTLEETSASANWPESRTFSIASYLNDKNLIRLIIKRAGPFTGRMFDELRQGSKCYIKYAYGDFLLPMFDDLSRIHCIAGGTGIAPFLSYIECMDREGSIDRLFLYYSVRLNCEFVAQEYIRNVLCDRAKFYCTREEVPGSFHRHFNVDDVLLNTENISNEHFYICGSSAFIKEIISLLQLNGAVNIYTDEWT